MSTACYLSVQADREPDDLRTAIREEQRPEAQRSIERELQGHPREEQAFGPGLYLPDRHVRSVAVHGWFPWWRLGQDCGWRRAEHVQQRSEVDGVLQVGFRWYVERRLQPSQDRVIAWR
jgi:hypothetical protein